MLIPAAGALVGRRRDWAAPRPSRGLRLAT